MVQYLHNVHLDLNISPENSVEEGKVFGKKQRADSGTAGILLLRNCTRQREMKHSIGL